MKHYIYIPGFNDWFDPLRRLALLRWRGRSTNTTLVPMRWSDRSETWEQKYARVAQAIEVISEDNDIVLVGESAGGAMALLAFARNHERVSKVVTICGYNHGSADIHSIYRQRKPAFYDTSQRAEQVIEEFTPAIRRRIATIYSTADKVVTPNHTRISGAHEVVLNEKSHFRSIVYILLKGLKSDVGHTA